MIKLFLKTILILITVGVLAFVGVGILILTDGEKEIVELKNDFNEEKIYLIKLSWGLGDSKIAIGLNKKIRTGFSNTPKDKYVENIGTEFLFYKFENGKLLVYNDHFEEPLENEFQTDIVFVELTNPEFINLGKDKNYEAKGISVFPESAKKRLNYVDTLRKKDK